MKNKKLFYAVIVMVALLCLGIGYAAVSKNLTINGRVNADAAGSDALQVLFTSSKDTNCTTSIADGGQSATITTNSLKTVGEEAKAVITITNNSQHLRAIITKLSGAFDDNSYNTYFTLTISEISSTPLAANGGTTTVTVTITLKQLPVDAISGAGFTITLQAEGAELA